MDFYNERIKPLFDSTGLDVQGLSKEIGIPVKTIYNWNKRGFKKYNEYVPKIAKYFNVSVGYLVGTTDEKSPSPDKDRLSAFDAQIIDFVHHLPPEKLRGILLALDAPKELLDELDRKEQSK